MVKKITLKNGDTRYEARWRDNLGEHRHRFRTKKDAEAALQLGRDRRRRLRAGMSEERPSITYGELADMFLAQTTVRSDEWRAQMLAYSVRQFGHLPLGDLRPDRIGNWLNQLPHAPKTQKHILDLMRQALNAAVEWDYLTKSPARPQAVRGPKQVDPDIRPFRSWDEIDLVADAAGDYGSLILFASATGLRPEEWIPLCWDDIDIRDRSLRIERTCVDGRIERRAGKTEAAFRTISLQKRALDALAALPRPLDGKQLVFPAPLGGLIDLDNWRRRVWTKALKESGLEHRPLYQMRHTFATLALEAGADLYWVSKQLGHKDIRVTLKFYARFEKGVDDRNLRILDEWAA